MIGKNKPFFVGTLENYPSGGIRSREHIDLRRDINLDVLSSIYHAMVYRVFRVSWVGKNLICAGPMRLMSH